MRHEHKSTKKASEGRLHVDLPLHDEENCLRWEAAFVDLLDGTLSPGEEAAFRQHADGCPSCQALLQESQQGKDWVLLLHDAPPAIPEDLLGKILARTASADAAQGSGGFPPSLAHSFPPVGNALMLPPGAYAFHGQREARFLMTAAMAFFSIALTLSLTGIHLGDFHAAGRAPALFEATAYRQFFDTKKQVVSFYDNLRLVREMEVAMNDAMPRTTR